LKRREKKRVVFGEKWGHETCWMVWCGVVDGRRRRKRQNTLTKTKKERGTRESMKHQH
jgi:hypothetical protein